MQPFADVEPNHVQPRGRCQSDERKHDGIGGATRKGLPFGWPNVEHVKSREIENGWKVRKIGSPVGPRGHEAREIAEGALRPDVQASLIRIARGKFDDRKREQGIKSEPRAEPDKEP